MKTIANKRKRRIMSGLKRIVKDYQIDYGQKLGYGSESSVYAAYDLVNKKQIAVKCRSLKNIKNRQYFEKVVELLSKLDHSNILKIHDYFVNENKNRVKYGYMFMDKYKNSDLDTFVETNGCLTARQGWAILVQICRAMKYLNDHRIIHNDVKPANMLVKDDNKSIVLCDFSYAQCLQDDKQRRNDCGTPLFMAPEKWNDNHMDVPFAADVWSVGVSIYWVLTKEFPFDPENDCVEDLKKILLDENYLPKKIPNISDGFWQILLQMLNHHPKRRTSWQTILDKK